MHVVGSDWYRDAVIYQAHVRGFFDATNDGVGDFTGLTAKLDYIQALGVTAIWLQPFYPSPLRDDGYDIADYRGIHPQYGTRRDFLTFLHAAHARGLRVITELVINHTSDQHPWFQAARRAPRGSAKRSYYVWSDSDARYAGVPIVFKDTERSNWTWDSVAGQYYWHRFFHHQPDLNFDNPRVVRAVLKVMRFWLDMGVDGMRLDAVPYLVERDGTQCANLPETHAVLKRIRREIDEHYPDRMLLAEANQWPSDVREYFGDGDECHMAFHFPLMPRLYMALQQEDRHPLSEILYQMPDIPDRCQWAIFLRNHDELTLEMVSDDERDYLYQAYAADPAMRLNVGIRRRLAPLLENSRPRIELMTALLLSLPGTPVLYYGDELGMGDNVYLGDRHGVRTPMQWSADRNGGFSRADPARLYAPPIMDPVYGFASVNVEAQERSAHSLLAWMRRTIALRQRHPAFGRGTMEILRPANRHIFAFIRRYATDDPILVVANLSRTVQPVSLALTSLRGLVPVEMSGGVALPRIGDAPYPLTLGPHAIYWLKLQREPQSEAIRVRATGAQQDVELGPLLIGPEWGGLLAGSTGGLLERRYLPAFLLRQEWFTRHGASVGRVSIRDWGTVREGHDPVFLMIVTSTPTPGQEVRSVIPCGAASGPRAVEIARDTPDAVIARLGGARDGVLHARIDGAVGRSLLDVFLARGAIRMRHGELRAAAGPASPVSSTLDESLAPAPRDDEPFASSASFSERFMVKIARRLWAGPHPSMALSAMLDTRASRPHIAPVLGTLDYITPDGSLTPVSLIETFVAHQTDGWTHVVNHLRRVMDTVVDAATPPVVDPVVALRLGQRLGELHVALGSDEVVRLFGDRLLDDADLDRYAASALASWEAARHAMRDRADLDESSRGLIAQLSQTDAHVRERIAVARRRATPGSRLIRTHANLDLDHVLVHEGDVTFAGLADDVSVSPEARAALRSPLEDVSRVLLGIENAAAAARMASQSASMTEVDRRDALVRRWIVEARAQILVAYMSATVGAALIHTSVDAVRAILRLFEVERASRDVTSTLAAEGAGFGIAATTLLQVLDHD